MYEALGNNNTADPLGLRRDFITRMHLRAYDAVAKNRGRKCVHNTTSAFPVGADIGTEVPENTENCSKIV
jgi:hypothetical protein